MFGRHQKATAHWQCSIWPNMEGKNAAFSRNQTGKREKKGRFSCMLCAQRDRALTLTPQWPQSWLLPKAAWLMVMSDLPWHLSQHCWANAHKYANTCTTQESWKKGTPIFWLRWRFIFKHTKSFLRSRIWALYHSQQCTLNLSPLEGNIPLCEKSAVSNATVLYFS